MPGVSADENTLEVAVCTTIGGNGSTKVCHEVVGFDEDDNPVVPCNTPGRYRIVEPAVYPRRRPCSDGCWTDGVPCVLEEETAVGGD